MGLSTRGRVVQSNLFSAYTRTASSRSPLAARSRMYMLCSEVGKQSIGLPL